VTVSRKVERNSRRSGQGLRGPDPPRLLSRPAAGAFARSRRRFSNSAMISAVGRPLIDAMRIATIGVSSINSWRSARMIESMPGR
jgi:hypothetical protein